MERLCHPRKPAKRGFYPSQLTDQVRRALIKEKSRNPKIILVDLGSFSAELGISDSVHHLLLIDFNQIKKSN